MEHFLIITDVIGIISFSISGFIIAILIALSLYFLNLFIQIDPDHSEDEDRFI